MTSRVPAVDDVRATILAVDDTPANLIALEALLQPLGYDLVTASSGAEALQLAAAREFAVVLLDVMMPGLDGFQTLQAMRELPLARLTPVIFLTARDVDQSVLERAYAFGAVDFIQKPLSAPVLRAKVSAFVALFQQRQEIMRQAGALRAKDHHLGVLAHALRTPISVIAMAAARLEEHDDARVRSSALRIARSVHRIQALSDDLLEWARIAAGAVQLKHEELDLSVLCEELLGDLVALHPQVTFTRALPSSLRGTWDRARLQQAVSNLLTNAVKYGTGWVRLTVSRNVDRVQIAVTNGCSPMTDEQIERLFAPYAQGPERRPGVGLGLHIVREIARAHGGIAYGEWRGEEIAFIIELPWQPREGESTDGSVPPSELVSSAPG